MLCFIRSGSGKGFFFLVCNYSHMPIQQQFYHKQGKISAPPHPTLCIQFLDRENNDKNNTLPLGKQICFTILGGCAEILPKILLLLHFTNLYSVLTGDTLSWSSFRQVSKGLLSSEVLSNAAVAKTNRQFTTTNLQRVEFRRLKSPPFLIRKI